jgi:hypothetical protein
MLEIYAFQVLHVAVFIPQQISCKIKKSWILHMKHIHNFNLLNLYILFTYLQTTLKWICLYIHKYTISADKLEKNDHHIFRFAKDIPNLT